MNARLLPLALLLVTSLPAALPVEPGTISLEDVLAKPVRLAIKAETPIYYQSTMDRVLGSMAPGTIVSLVGMSDTAYRVRGRARHGDVSGWIFPTALVLPDPKFPEKLKAFYERQKEVSDLIAAHRVAIGMTKAEVALSLGKPARSKTRVTAAGKEESVEYAMFERVPQTLVGTAPNGQLVQSVVYVKMEVGTLSISLKDGRVEAIEETKGAPLGGQPVKIVPMPIILN